MQRKIIALQALRAASNFLRKQFRIAQGTSRKDDGTLVSAADHGSEERIIRVLRTHFPDDAILSEERGALPGRSAYRWILDPLDGTHNFLSHIPLFGILLALEKKGKVILSFCVFPMLNEIFVAEKGKGAFMNNRRIRVSRTSALHDSVFLGDGNSALEFATIMQDVQPFHAEGCRFRFLGEGPFGMTRVALGGVLSALVRPGKIWDIAAPALLVEEAGGKVTDLHGRKWNLTPRPLLATNGRVHQKILSLIVRGQ